MTITIKPSLSITIVAKKDAPLVALTTHFSLRHKVNVIEYTYSKELIIDALVWNLADTNFVKDHLGEHLLNIIISPNAKID